METVILGWYVMVQTGSVLLLASGVLIERIGYPLTISVFSTVGLVFTLLIGIRWRASLWQRRRQPTATTLPQRG